MRRVAMIVGGILLALLAAELCLQAFAWVLWNRRALPSPSGINTGGVLCVGDSFTYGLGARDRGQNSYPRALERHLGQTFTTEGAPSVINAGWPGQDSRAVLNGLRSQLATYRPKIVYALVGYNDFWKSTPDLAPEGFPLRFRLGALASLMLHALLGTVEDGGDPGSNTRLPSEAPFLGPWHVGTMWFEFRADGTLDAPGASLPILWSWHDDEILLRNLDVGDESVIEFRLADDQLTLEGGPFPVSTALVRGLPHNDVLDRARIAMRADRHAEVEALLREALTTPREPEARADLIEWLAARGRQSEANQLIEPMRITWQDAPTPDGGKALVDALLHTGDVTAAMRIAGEYLATQPFDQSIAKCVVRESLRLEDPDDLETQLRIAIAREDFSSVERAALHGVYRALAPADLPRQAAALVATLLADPDSPNAQRALTWEPQSFPRSLFVAALERQAQGDRAVERLLLARYEAMLAGTDHTEQGLAFGLHAIADLCLEAGAEIIFLTYPANRPQVRATILGYGTEHGVPVIDVFDAFSTRVPGAQERAALFVLDGHCNDAGYRLMGEIVAEDAHTRLTR